MGFRLFKSKKIAPGIRINLSKSGPSVSVGPKGAKVNVGPKGVRTTLTAPGTGIQYRKQKGWNSKAQNIPTLRLYGNMMEKVTQITEGANSQLREASAAISAGNPPYAAMIIKDAHARVQRFHATISAQAWPAELHPAHSTLIQSVGCQSEGLQMIGVALQAEIQHADVDHVAMFQDGMNRYNHGDTLLVQVGALLQPVIQRANRQL